MRWFKVGNISIMALVISLAAALSPTVARGQNIYVANYAGVSGTIGKYTMSGGTVNASLVSGLWGPTGLAASGSNVFVSNGSGTIGEYTTSGGTVNASLVSGQGHEKGTSLGMKRVESRSGAVV